MEKLIQIFCFFVFMMEGFLSGYHLLQGLSVRALPLKDMQRLQYFFLFATLTVATTIQTVQDPYWWADTLVLGHHAFCYFTWNKSGYTKQLMHWSSLNWTGSRMKHVPFFLGSLGLSLLHGFHAFLLAQEMDLQLTVLALVAVHSAIWAVMYNPRLAWATPGNLPDWVAKRVEDSKSLLPPNKAEKSIKKKQ